MPAGGGSACLPAGRPLAEKPDVLTLALYPIRQQPESGTGTRRSPALREGRGEGGAVKTIYTD